MSVRRRRSPLGALACALGLAPLAAAAGGRHDAGLVPALQSGDHARVQRLLASKAADPDLLLPDGSTPLSWAVETQDPRMVRLLLDARAKPDAARNPAAAPLMLACEHGNPEIIAMLLDARADVRRARQDGIAPLALCAATAPATLLGRMIERGAVVDAADDTGQTPLMHAAASGRVDNLQVLLANGANVNRVTASGFSPLFFALKSGNPEAPVAVLEAGGDPDHVGPEKTTAVQLAMYQKDPGFAARMIERGADVAAFDREGHTLLHAAVLADQPALVRALLARGADPNLPTAKPRIEWRYEANFRTGDVVHPAKSPLLLAAERGSAESLRLLAAAGADPGYRLADGTSLVHAAVTHDRLVGKPDAVAAALALLPDPNVVDANGRTPLHLLLGSDPGSDTAAVMKILAAQGARVDIPDAKGVTAAKAAVGADTASEVRAAYEAAFGAVVKR